MARQSGNTMKVDVALPLDFFKKVMELAEESNAPIHHRSNQRVLSPTIVQLIGLGIQSLKDSDGVFDPSSSISLGGMGNDSRLTALVDRIGKLEDSLKDNSVFNTESLTATDIEGIVSGYVDKATQPLFDGLINLQSQLAEVKANCDLTTEGRQGLIADALSKLPKPAKPAAEPKKPSGKSAGGDWISFSEFAKEHGLNVTRESPAADVISELAATGLDAKVSYDSRKKRFIRLGAK